MLFGFLFSKFLFVNLRRGLTVARFPLLLRRLDADYWRRFAGFRCS